MSIRNLIILLFLVFPNFIFAQLEYDIEDGYVRIYDYLDAFDLLDTVGDDGIRILFPDSWGIEMGDDGRIITYPSNWKTEMGEDGRLVAFPNQWKSKVGDDGRVVPIPHYQIIGQKKGRWVKKKKSPNCHSVNPDDCYVACYEEASTGYSWNWSEGLDNRLIAVTTDLKDFEKNGGDGRRLIIPKDWNTHDTSNGRTIAAPPSWELEEYEDDTFVMIPPFKSAETIFDIFEEENNLFLVFNQPYQTMLLQKIKTSNAEEALDVSLYWFLNGY